MGLPGSGKTTLAEKLVPLLKAEWLNADRVREEQKDWDFSNEGRLRQAKRLADKAQIFKLNNKNVNSIHMIFSENIKNSSRGSSFVYIM